MKKKLTVPEQHQLKIARRTVKMNDVIIAVLGGMTRQEAEQIIARSQQK